MLIQAKRYIAYVLCCRYLSAKRSYSALSPQALRTELSPYLPNTLSHGIT